MLDTGELPSRSSSRIRSQISTLPSLPHVFVELMAELRARYDESGERMMHLQTALVNLSDRAKA